MSDTPRTDEFVQNGPPPISEQWSIGHMRALIDHARTLERELAASEKALGDLMVSESAALGEANRRLSDVQRELEDWKIAGYDEGGVRKCATELKRERDDAQRKLGTATEALKAALDWIGDDPVDRASESGPWLSSEGYEAIEKIKTAYAEVTK